MWHLVDHWTATRDQADDDIVPILISSIEPTLTRFGISPANRGQRGPSVVWCSPTDEIRVSGQDLEHVWCTDLWVEVNQADKTISAHLEGKDLLSHVAGRGVQAIKSGSVPLHDGLIESVDAVAKFLDELCAKLLVDPTAPEQQHR